MPCCIPCWNETPAKENQNHLRLTLCKWAVLHEDIFLTWWWQSLINSRGSSLTHWGCVTHICVGKLTIIGSDNGLSPERRQAIIWINAGILLIGPLGTNFSEILIEIQTFSLKKMRLKMLSAKCCSFRFGLNVLMINDNKLNININGYGLLWNTCIRENIDIDTISMA